MKFLGRQLKLWSAIAIAGVLLAGCAASPPESPAADSSDASASDESTEDSAQGDSPAVENELECNWDSPAVLVESDPLTPTGQEGQLADALIGAWQQVGYDSGDGYKTFTGYGDFRYFFAQNLDLLYCQNWENSDHGERRGTLVLEGDEIVFPESRFTAMTWGENAMTWLNQFDGSTIYLQRR